MCRHCRFDTIEDIYYSRRNFKRPALQHSQHRSFNTEVELLDKLFPEGAAYCMGTINRSHLHCRSLPLPYWGPSNY